MHNPKILHLIESVTRGGAMRAAIAIAKYSPRTLPSTHSVAPLKIRAAEPEGTALAEQAGMKVHIPSSKQDLDRLIEEADVVHLHWWNNPYVDQFLRSPLPANRLVIWCHVGGHAPPQIIPHEILSFADFVVACSPYTYESSAFTSLPSQIRTQKTAMAYGPADFERIGVIEKTPHATFNIGYIGTTHFSKMHRQFIRMSALARIPDAHFIVCGSGGAEETLKKEAREIGQADKFEIRGYVEDIRPILSTLDVYGYPLCKDNYSGSEINLQEVMYAGIPVVTFPYGGISRLIVDNVTGVFVRSEEEYAKALEHLYHHPEERKRLGANAKAYAERLFGAAPAASIFNRIYTQLLSSPKTTKTWNMAASSSPSERFVQSLGEWGAPFLKSRSDASLSELLAGDLEIARSSELMRTGGIAVWQRAYPTDAWLNFWRGIAELESGSAAEALHLLIEASAHGFSHWRLAWYIARAAEKLGNRQAASQAAEVVLQADPQFPGLQELIARLNGK